MHAGSGSREAREALAAERASAQERLTGLERDSVRLVPAAAAAARGSERAQPQYDSAKLRSD